MFEQLDLLSGRVMTYELDKIAFLHEMDRSFPRRGHLVLLKVFYGEEYVLNVNNHAGLFGKSFFYVSVFKASDQDRILFKKGTSNNQQLFKHINSAVAFIRNALAKNGRSIDEPVLLDLSDICFSLGDITLDLVSAPDAKNPLQTATQLFEVTPRDGNTYVVRVDWAKVFHYGVDCFRTIVYSDPDNWMYFAWSSGLSGLKKDLRGAAEFVRNRLIQEGVLADEYNVDR